MAKKTFLRKIAGMAVAGSIARPKRFKTPNKRSLPKTGAMVGVGAVNRQYGMPFEGEKTWNFPRPMPKLGKKPTLGAISNREMMMMKKRKMYR